MTARKTYSHLAGLGRVPSAYDVGTSQLLYYPTRGFEVATPIAGFYARYQEGSRLRLRDPERFRDPRETTYAHYTELQKTQEIFVDGLLRALDSGAYDRGLAPAWVRTLGAWLGPLRYPVHGLQMVAAYLGSMAPGGRIVITCALQAADEIRRIQRLAYRLRQLQETHPHLGADSKARWQDDPMWQPLRRVIERLLVTYDWGEAFTALALVVKPAFDELMLVHFGRLAAVCGDEVLEKIFASLDDDARWQRDWACALARCLVEEKGDNPAALAEWIARWTPDTRTAIAAFAPLYTEAARGRAAAPGFAEVLAKIDDSSARLRLAAGLEAAR